VTPPTRRGVKVGVKRGKYTKRARESARRRVFDAAREGGDWQLVAKNNGIKVDTARNWIVKGTPTLLATGGKYH